MMQPPSGVKATPPAPYHDSSADNTLLSIPSAPPLNMNNPYGSRWTPHQYMLHCLAMNNDSKNVPSLSLNDSAISEISLTLTANNKSLLIPAVLKNPNSSKVTTLHPLLDSGAQENFISPLTIEWLGL
ncbi:hypothetical protein P691DRAFT_769005 [Macrolepiota fuliginosa MF-IS2]|uniref:Uncharacterized protein n=1 Tax=Macrolepiota fuliginosa MF-IS2 TaxID=1400762 RepID=A0A9P5WW49_9AGAR|nr:hypothetical protein P691DRAFT_769005 [Macrolepiota fuliginosa MF-IS2]